MAEFQIRRKRKSKKNTSVTERDHESDSGPHLVDEYVIKRGLAKDVVDPKAGDRRQAVRTLEAVAREQLKRASQATNVDMLINGLSKYTGLLGEYSPFNAFLIHQQDTDYTQVRNKTEWERFGYRIKKDARPIAVLYPMGGGKRSQPGQVIQFVEKKRAEGVSDEEIDAQVHEKFRNTFVPTHSFGIGTVYDKKSVEAIPGKRQVNVADNDTEMKASNLYELAKAAAKANYTVTETSSMKGERGYTTMTHEGATVINVSRIPDENTAALHTLFHELAHARLDHLKAEGRERGVKEAEADLTAFLVGEHYGFRFDGSDAYIGAWLKGHQFGEENIDRVMNGARWIIQQVDAQKLRSTPVTQNVKQGKVMIERHDFPSTLPKDSLIPGDDYKLVMARGKDYAVYMDKKRFGEVNEIVIQKRTTDSGRELYELTVRQDNGWGKREHPTEDNPLAGNWFVLRRDYLRDWPHMDDYIKGKKYRPKGKRKEEYVIPMTNAEVQAIVEDEDRVKKEKGVDNGTISEVAPAQASVS